MQVVEVTKEFLGFQPGDQLFLDEDTETYHLVTIDEVEGEGLVGRVEEEATLAAIVVKDNLGEYFIEVPQKEIENEDETEDGEVIEDSGYSLTGEDLGDVDEG